MFLLETAEALHQNIRRTTTMSSPTEFPELSGEELQRLSDAHPYIKPTGLGPAIIGLLITWSIITTIVVGLRVWVKTRHLEPGQKWGVDDYLAVIGYVRRPHWEQVGRSKRVHTLTNRPTSYSCPLCRRLAWA